MKRFAYLFLILLLILILAPDAKASITFFANFDNGLNAQSGAEPTAYNDAIPPALVAGFGGSGKAVQNTYGTTLKYKTSNLNSSADTISFKFQLPFNLAGDREKAKITQGYSKIDVSSSTHYIYIADVSSDQIIRASINGDGWGRLGSHGTGDGNFNFGWSSDVSVDPNTEYLYVSDHSNSRIIKTKFDGSGWTTYETTGRTPSHITYDPSSDYVFYYDDANDEIVKEKFGGASSTTLDVSGLIDSYLTDFTYDTNTEYLYISDFYKIVRVKIDGSGLSDYGSEGSGANQFDMAYSIDFYDDYLYVCDENNGRMVKTKFGGTGWTTYGSSGIGEGKFNDPLSLAYDQATDDIYVLDTPYRYGGNDLLIRTKIDGSNWASYATQGTGVIQEADSMYYDHDNQNFYIAGHTAQFFKTKKDGTGWQTFGEYDNSGAPYKFLYLTGVDVDPESGDVYGLDHYTNYIYKMNPDNDTWEKYSGPPGFGLSVPRGLSFDQNTDFIYVGDMDHGRIIKTKIDGSGWIGYGTSGSGIGQFDHPLNVFHDDVNDYTYVSDYSNNRITRFKFGVGDASWQEIDTSAYFAWGGPEFVVDEGTDIVYTHSGTNQIVKLDMNGTEIDSFSTTGGNWPSGIEWATPVFYDQVDDTLYLDDSYNIYHCTTTGEYLETITANPEKVLFKTDGAKPFELSLSAYNGKFGLSLNKYNLPISLSAAQTMTQGSWHDISITFDRSVGSASVFLDGDSTPIIQETGLGSGSEIGTYFYLGSDHDDPNRTFPGAIDDLAFGINPISTTSPSASSATPTPSSSASKIPVLTILPETGSARSKIR